MAEHKSGLTDKEFDDFNRIVMDTIEALLDCADEHNIDRNSFLKYFANMFSAMVQISTFENYNTRTPQKIEHNSLCETETYEVGD